MPSESPEPAEPAAPADVQLGLWGRSGLKAAPSRQLVLFYISLIFLGYAFSLFINGASGKLFKPRFTLPALAPGADPLTPLGWVVLVLDPMFLLATFRFLSCCLLVACMTAARDTPLHTGVGEQGTAVRSDAMTLTWRAGVPILVGCTNALGYLFYLALTSRGGVAIWSALVGLYVVLPVSFGIFTRGEDRSSRKLLGIAVCVLASILLGWGEEVKEASAVPWYSNFFLYITCISLWGVCDGLSAFMGRDLHLWWVALLTGLGFGLVALMCALCSFIITGSEAHAGVAGSVNITTSTTSTSSSASQPSLILSSGWGYALSAVAQVLGVAAWFTSVKLGVLAEASAFLPVISLYTIGASLLAIPVLGETNLPPLYWVGVVFAVAGILLIAYSGKKEQGQLLEVSAAGS
jgi:uncharacterized membrane protein